MANYYVDLSANAGAATLGAGTSGDPFGNLNEGLADANVRAPTGTEYLYCKGNATYIEDTVSAYTINTSFTSSTNRRVIKGDPGDTTYGLNQTDAYSATHYTIHSTANSITLRDPGWDFENVQIFAEAGASNVNGVISFGSGGDDTKIVGCHTKATSTGAGNAFVIQCTNSTGVGSVRACTFFLDEQSTGLVAGVYLTNCTSFDVWNCTFAGNSTNTPTYGIRGGAVAVSPVIKNNIFTGCGTDVQTGWTGSPVVDYNIGDQDLNTAFSASNNDQHAAATTTEWNKCHDVYNDGSFSLVTSSTAQNTGTTTGRPTSVDLVGTTWAGSEAGAIAYAAGGGGGSILAILRSGMGSELSGGIN